MSDIVHQRRFGVYLDKHLIIQMNKFPEAVMPSLDLPEYERVLLKNFPQFSVYRNLSEFVQKYSIFPCDVITGKFNDFEYLTGKDWDSVKWSYYLYLKLRMDLEDECEIENMKQGFF